jgi:hypothetical protein
MGASRSGLPVEREELESALRREIENAREALANAQTADDKSAAFFRLAVAVDRFKSEVLDRMTPAPPEPDHWQ